MLFCHPRDMKSQILKFLITAAPFTLSLLILFPINASYAGEVTPPRTRCFITIEDAHISKYILKHEGRRAVKVNAYSTCNVTQSNVELTVKIFKVGAFGSYLIKQKSTKPLSKASNGLVVTNFFTYEYCKNEIESVYYGVAYSKAIINGKTYVTAPDWSANPSKLKCGT